MQLNIGTRQYRTKPKQFASINNDVIGNIVDLSLEELLIVLETKDIRLPEQ